MLTSHQQSALDLSKHIALTANAGSGKTFVLSKRFLEIALSGTIPLRKIAAITFTEKAAAELYKKTAAQVEEMIASSTDERVISRLRQIRRSLVSANISTIHSFCINLLREYPVEAELDANFSPIDNTVSDELTEISVEEVIKAALLSDEDSPRIKSLIRLFSSTRIFARELINLILNRKNIYELKKKLYYKNTGEIASYFFDTFIKITGDYLDKKLPDFISDLTEFINEVLEDNPANKTALEVIPVLKKLQDEIAAAERIKLLQNLWEIICTKEGNIRKCLSRKFKKETPAQLKIADFLSGISYFFFEDDHSASEKELASIGKILIYFFDKAIERYNEKKRIKGYLDFEDILLNTKKLLENEDVRNSIWNKFDFIMIDEYQDTNEIQYEIFLPILDYLKRGNLFVVGDEKQSIYMFRDAELEVFDRTKKLINDSDTGKILVLPDSFRMGPEICLFTNYIFSRLFSDPDLLFNEVAHSELVCARPDPVPGEVQFLLEQEEGISEAELASAKILHLVKEKGVKWNQIAVLSRKRKSFDELEAAFSENKIPYLILGGRNFYQRQSIFDIYNYFCFLLDNNNDGALAGILRSPFFNLSDSKLYEISQQSGYSFFRKLIAFQDETLDPVKEKLLEMADLAGYKDAPELLRKMLNDSQFSAYLASKKNGPQETANIRKLVKVTINFYGQGFRTLYDYVNFLKTGIEQIEDESQALIADESNTVKIMTIHQAKGLEFPVVFLFKSGDSAQKSIVRQKSIVVNKEFGILTKVPVNENYYEDYVSAPIVSLNNFIALKKDNAELKRLLYVGITRAKDSLYITAARKDNYNADSFMGLLSRAFPEGFGLNSLSVESELKFLKTVGDKFKVSKQSCMLNIGIISEIPKEIIPESDTIPSVKEIITGEIKDSVKDEIISATRYAVYRHCPLKYKFTYQDGLLPLIKNNLRQDDEDEKDESIIAGAAGLKGRVIHKILQASGENADIESVKNLIRKEEIDLNGNATETLACEIVNDLSKYFTSKIYREIRNSGGLNEYEVYFKENGYILFGIIDKLIIKEDSITIIDYKTDDIPSDKISERAEEYFNQLKFYSYIIWNAFNFSYERILFKIIFIKYPDTIIEMEQNREDLIKTGTRIREMVENSRKSIFSPDKSYCRKCIYSEDHINCIKRD